jgi:UDPglucose 6-dehydrogenase
VEKVAQGMGLDARIGKDFLRAGLGFGGFCFPKDLQAFVRIAEKNGYDFLLLREVEKINKARIEVALEKLKKELWVLQGKTIGILGLAFKPQTDDTRFAPALELIRRLLKEGVKVRAYDPKAEEKTREEFPDIFYAKSAYEAAEGTEALILATEWTEFRQLDWGNIRQAMIHPYIFDGRNFLDAMQLRSLGFRYEGMGRLE